MHKDTIQIGKSLVCNQRVNCCLFFGKTFLFSEKGVLGMQIFQKKR